MNVAVITGGSRGFGFELARSLAADGWRVVIDGRNAEDVHLAAEAIGTSVHAVPGDVRDAEHRTALVRTAERLGALVLLVNNASVLGPSPQPALGDYPLDELAQVFDVNVLAPIGLIQAALPTLRRRGGSIVDITSDAGVEGYPGWGGYGSSKAALEHASTVLAAEEPDVRVYTFDPGDMRTQMHQEAFPGEDISDRPLPSTVVPALRRLLDAPPTQWSLPRHRRGRDDRHGGGVMTAVAGTPVADRLSFDLPPALEAGEPPEARGLTRDGVRMLVAERRSGRLQHSTFVRLPALLDAGDLVVVNTSGVLPAAVTATDVDGAPVVVHFSTRLDDGRWVVELRQRDGQSTRRWTGSATPRDLVLGDRATLHLEAPFQGSDRLWVSTLRLPQPVFTWLAAHGQPIRYGYVEHPWPIATYQNVYATEPGSAEMPSAGRPFTADVIMRLVAKGVDVAPLVLHTGVASLESTELPYPERVKVPPTTAERVNATRARRGRVIAVGTTVVRALETAGASGTVEPFDGWTDLVITPQRGVRIVDGLLTGWHEPEASHLLMLEAVGGRELLERSYAASLAEGYLWHEFGDEHLILP